MEHVSKIGWVALALASAYAGVARAAPDGEAIALQGNGQVPACASCHGPAFEGQPQLKAPALAGRSASFIVARLVHYAGPDGHNPTMRAVASGLTDAERRAVADYLARWPAASATPRAWPRKDDPRRGVAVRPAG